MQYMNEVFRGTPAFFAAMAKEFSEDMGHGMDSVYVDVIEPTRQVQEIDSSGFSDFMSRISGQVVQPDYVTRTIPDVQPNTQRILINFTPRPDSGNDGFTVSAITQDWQTSILSLKATGDYMERVLRPTMQSRVSWTAPPASGACCSVRSCAIRSDSTAQHD